MAADAGGHAPDADLTAIASGVPSAGTRSVGTKLGDKTGVWMTIRGGLVMFGH